MSYDSATDPVITALRAIAMAEVVGALAPTLGADYPAILASFPHPIPLALVGTMQQPALGVYVQRETVVPVGRHRDFELLITLEYVGPLTPLDKIATTWPLLRAVWAQCITKMQAGTVASIDVLRLLGVTWFGDEGASVNYDFVSSGEYAFPGFLGQFTLRYRPAEFDITTLPALTELYARLDLYENGAKTVDSLVVVRATVP